MNSLRRIGLGIVLFGAAGLAIAAAPVPTKLVVKPAPRPYQNYHYQADRYRDPFIPLIGTVRSDTALERPPQVASLVLKGVIYDARGRIALLTSGVGSYLLRNGRLYDARNHMVKGISGVIRPNSVLLIGSDHTVRNLPIKGKS